MVAALLEVKNDERRVIMKMLSLSDVDAKAAKVINVLSYAHSCKRISILVTYIYNIYVYITSVINKL